MARSPFRCVRAFPISWPGVGLRGTRRDSGNELRIVAHSQNRTTVEPSRGTNHRGQRMQGPDDELVGVDTAARFLGCSPTKVYQLGFNSGRKRDRSDIVAGGSGREEAGQVRYCGRKRDRSDIAGGSGTGPILLSQATFLLAHIANSGPVPLFRFPLPIADLSRFPVPLSPVSRFPLQSQKKTSAVELLATGYSRALHDPDTIFVPVYRHAELHRIALPGSGWRFWRRQGLIDMPRRLG